MKGDQELINAIFQIAQISAYWWGKPEKEYYKDGHRDKHMEWVAKQLDLMGYSTKPIGSSWGVLQDKEDKNG